MSKIFIDANFIIAIFREIENNHEIAFKTCETLLNTCDCYISNSIISEVITIMMMRTKNIELTSKAYYFMLDNFKVLNELDIPNYNTKVFKLFEKYNNNRFNLGYVDCSIPVICDYYGLDCVVTFDKNFSLFSEIKLYAGMQ